MIQTLNSLLAFLWARYNVCRHPVAFASGAGGSPRTGGWVWTFGCSPAIDRNWAKITESVPELVQNILVLGVL